MEGIKLMGEFFSEVMEYMPLLIDGTKITILVFFFTLLFSLPLGLPIALGEECKFKPLAWLCKAYVWVFRGTPLMLQLCFFYFALPMFVPSLRLDVIETGIVTFILNYAAYFAEIYRGGLKSIDKGQYEASFALGLSKKQTLFDIVLPQTMKAILPPVINEAITLIKDTALIMTIGGAELMKNAYAVVSRTSQVSSLIVAGVIYLILTLLLTLVAGRLEKHFARYDQKGE